MSKYFDALRRLEKRGGSPRRRPFRSSKQAEPSLEASPQVISFPDSPLTNEQEAAYAILLDSLRTLAGTSGTPVVVLAGLTSAEPTHSVVTGLAAQAGSRGLQMLAGELRVSPGRVLEAHRSVPTESQRAFPLELAGSNEGLPTLLKELNISNNLFTSLPTEIGNLTALTKLYLSDNQLTSLPSTIGNLTTLSRLYLHSNQLTSLPTEIRYVDHLLG